MEKRAFTVLFSVLIILSPLSEAILPYFYKLFVDTIPTSDYPQLVRLLGLYLIVYLASRLIDTLARLVGDAISIDAAKNTRIAVFEKIHELDFAFHTTKSSGSLISTIKRGDGAFFDLFHSIHYRIVSVAVQFGVMMIFFYTLNPGIFMIIGASFVAALVITGAFVRSNINIRKLLNDEEDKISAVIVDNMINFETVKLFAKEKWEKARLIRQFATWRAVFWKFGLSFRYLEIGMALVAISGILATLLFSLRATLGGRFTVGDFVLVVGFTAAFYPKLFDLVWGLRQIAKNYSDIQKYFEMLDLTVKVKDPDHPAVLNNPRGEIVFDKITFKYEEKNQNALCGFSLNIRSGQSVALVGRSGAGKTTVVKLLMRFFDPQKGEITVDGVNIKNLGKEDLRRLMGVVPQEPVLFNNTIGYNIAYGHELNSQEEIEAAAKLALIHDFIKSLPEGYETQVGERGIKLSGGQKQRIAIARMILADPKIVIFDEATSQLDSESEKMIQDAFWNAVRDKTTIIIAHRLSTVKRADKIVVMENGKMAESGSHNALVKQKSGLYRHLWDLQSID